MISGTVWRPVEHVFLKKINFFYIFELFKYADIKNNLKKIKFF
jgi:hypothetical protein